MLSWVKKIYIYLFSAIGLILVVIGGVQIINLGLKMFIFTKADVYIDYPRPVVIEEGEKVEKEEIDPEELEEYQKENLISRRQRQASNAIAMIIIGSPLFLYHWGLAKKMIND